MNIQLNGERTIQKNDGREYKRKFICFAEDVEGIRILGDVEEIHLKTLHHPSQCVACGMITHNVFAHYEYEDRAKWENHPRRCNFAYNPG